MQDNIEPTLEQIDDYNNKESARKRRSVRLIIAGILVVGLSYSYMVIKSEMPDDYIGTREHPGIIPLR